MAHICPATGHTVASYPHGPSTAPPPFCPHHGVKLFQNCRTCGAPWPVTSVGSYSANPNAGASFCSQCGAPATWLSRRELVQWLKAQVQASDVEAAERLELQGVLDRLADMDPGDTRAIAGWQKLRDGAPKVWAKAKPIIDILTTAVEVKKALGL